MTIIKLEDYTCVRKIGKGTFSKVYLLKKKNNIENKNNNIIVAKYVNPKFFKYVDKEINILKILTQHKNKYIINYLGNIKFVNNNTLLFFEKLDMNLYTFYKKKRYNIEDIKYISFQLFLGLNFIHNLEIIHTDIKPENIMINKDKSIKIIDFGSYQRNILPKKWFYVSSRYYRPPEAIYNLQYNEKLDIWSAICTIIELILKRPLFPASSSIELLLKINDLLGTPKNNNYKESKVYKNNIESNNITYYDTPYDNKFMFKEPLENLGASEFDSRNLFKLFDSVLVYDIEKRYNSNECLRNPLFLKYILLNNINDF